MKLLVFGTGDYCRKYLPYIEIESVVCFIDNDKTKHGKEFYGKPICSVQHIWLENYDYIIILIRNYYVIVEQLLDLKVSENKILLYSDLYDIAPALQKLNSKSNERDLSQWTKNRLGRKIFICSHDYSRSGVPVALMNLAILLKKMRYHVIMASLGYGSLEEELYENEIDFLVDIEGIYSSHKFLEQLKSFNLIILGTLVITELGRVFSSLNIPIMWWIHESDDMSFKDYRLPVNRGNIFYYGVGKRVLNKFSEYYPKETMKELHYFLPDIQVSPFRHLDVKVFATIGTLIKRKAQDILISAIMELPIKIREKCIFYFVGSSDNENRKMIEESCQKVEQIRYIYEISQKDMIDFYRQIDILICPSRDDPMPIVVTQALQNGIPCIISNQVGQCEYLNKIGGGVVFPSEDMSVLKQQITDFVLASANELEECSQKARKVYESYFSEELMKQNILKIFSELSID